jgi:hypothetical protein
VIIAEAHCSVEFHPDWPLSEDRGPLEGSLSQSVGDSDGSVFLHYGPSSTLETYVGALRERRGVELTADHPVVTADGLEGHCLGLALAEQVMSRRDAPRRVTPARTLMCNGFTIDGVPVLLGYLVPQAIEPELLDAAEAIIASLTAVR